ncbi:MAG TPA: nucleoside triphosphate pyrophosphohydrolase [Longilinea sp.]|nr:nucleoside triphosphate pyrophosphohydrolase [Longilinea sp.]
MSKQTQKGIIILGLGPGAVDQLTCEAWEHLQTLDEIYLRTSQHPTVQGFPPTLKVKSFDHFYESSERFEEVYAHIIAEVIRLGQRPQGVTYAVPGHPFVAEATAPAIVKQAREMGIPVKVIEGLSFLEPTFTALGEDPFPRMAFADALELTARQMPPFPPSEPALIAQIYSRAVASDVKLTLNSVYPDQHPVKLVHAAGTSQEVVEDLKLYEIDRSRHLGLLSSLYLPPLSTDAAFEDFQEIVARLRAPDGCPWDREQTHLTLRQHLLEETYETLEAMDAEDADGMREEFGDLLLQIVLNAQIGAEEGEFTMAEILQSINQKIVRRHPHVFGEVDVDDVKGVLKNWEKLKEKERSDNHVEKGLLDGVPKSLPALVLAQEYQERAARVGFDWDAIKPVWDKVAEEMEEVHTAEDEESRAKELGDLLFAVVNLIRWNKVEAESVLRAANQRFFKRFKYIEQKAKETGRNLTDMSLSDMDQWWDEAKKNGVDK